MVVYLIATLDTKGVEIGYVRDRLGEAGVAARVIDVGCLGEPAIEADVTREEVFEAAGTTLSALRERHDRGEAVTAAAEGVVKIVGRLQQRGELAGVLGIGGSAGTTIATAAMRALPLGVPKVMVSTLASGSTRRFVGDRDIAMVNAVVDILGLNSISRKVLGSAAAAMAGMVRFAGPADAEAAEGDRPLIAATMFGVTTPCIEHARTLLEQAGYEVLVFHATGNGGQALESLIRDRLLTGVLDLTTTELADELVGGFLSAGPDRLTAAAECGVPQVVSVGATDMVNFYEPASVPERFAGRTFYRHNPSTTLMRTNTEECAAIGRDLASKVARSTAPATILLPEGGVSAIDADGEPFNDPDARAALFRSIREHAGPVPVRQLGQHINDPAFAAAAVETLLQLIEQHQPASA